MSGERGVHPDCRNASNPYHECVDYCFKQIAETKARLSQNKADTAEPLAAMSEEMEGNLSTIYYRRRLAAQSLKSTEENWKASNASSRPSTAGKVKSIVGGRKRLGAQPEDAEKKKKSKAPKQKTKSSLSAGMATKSTSPPPFQQINDIVLKVDPDIGVVEGVGERVKLQAEQARAFGDGKIGPCHLNDDLANIPSSLGFDAKAKKKMVNEMLKCAPDGYEKSLKGFAEAHITPALVNLAEAMIRLGGISQWAASTQKEVKEVVGLATESMCFEQRQSKELTDLKCSYAQLVAANKALNLRCEEHEAARKTAEAAQAAAAKALKLSEETLQSLQTSISKAVDEVVQPLNAHIANLQNQLSAKQDDVTKQLMDAFKDGESSSHGHWLEAYKWACGDNASTSPAVMEKCVEWLKEKESRELLGRSPISEFIDDITDDKEEREDEDVVDAEN